MAQTTKKFATWGDLAREQVRRRGMLYSGDVEAEVRSRLDALSSHARKAFALACAERSMAHHMARPIDARASFTMSWLPLLEIMWQGLESLAPDAVRVVQDSLDQFHASEYDHDDGPDGPQDANEHAAAASIHACQCFVHGDVDSALWAATRRLDIVFDTAGDELQLDPNDFIWDADAEPMPLAQEEMHPVVQGELQRQLADVAMLETPGPTAETLARLRSPTPH